MNTKALIIFVRNPVQGKVKTRIAATAGEQEALRIYKELLRHTHAVSKSTDADKYVFYSDLPQLGDGWEDDLYHKLIQAGETLGDKMKDAFHRMFEKGYAQVVIIGSDCYELTAAIIEAAWNGLNEKDAVIGPARDGGYYLLGMKKFIPGIFENKKWSTSSVYTHTITDLEKAGTAYITLPLLNDVDTMEDVPEELLIQKKTS